MNHPLSDASEAAGAPQGPRWRRYLTAAALAAALLALAVLLAPLLGPFAFAVVVAYLLNPAVSWLQRHRVPRPAAAALSLLVMLAVILLFAVLVVLILQHQLPLLRDQVPALLAKLDRLLSPQLAALGIRLKINPQTLNQLLSTHIGESVDIVATQLIDTLRISGSAALTVVVDVLLVPLVAFYLLLDWKKMWSRLDGFVPRIWEPKVRTIAAEIDRMLSHYVRGQLLVMLVLSLYYAVALTAAGLDVGIPLGVFTGCAVLIPYLGYGIGLILALLAALLQFDDVTGLILVGSVYGFGQLLEGFYLTPRLVGGRIGMHPLAVIFVLLAFAQLFGFFGVLFALPACAILMVVWRELRDRYLASDFYRR